MDLKTALHERFVAWALRTKPPEPTPIVLGQRRIYVLPTRAGLAYAGTLLVLLLGAINYNLSLGYVLTFLLAGLGITAILHSFRNLARLTIVPGRATAVFAGETADFHLILESPGGEERRCLRLHLPGQEAVVTDVPAAGSGVVRLALPAAHRGWLALPRVTIDTEFPLGLVRAWAYCAPDFRCLVYPQPAAKAPPLPWAAGGAGGRLAGARGSEDFAGLRGHQPADPPRHVAWKIAARQGAEAPLLTKQFAGAAAASVWLDWNELPAGLGVEERLSLLTRWALDAHRDGLAWGLRLPGQTIGPAAGQAHLDACLTALALHGRE